MVLRESLSRMLHVLSEYGFSPLKSVLRQYLDKLNFKVIRLALGAMEYTSIPVLQFESTTSSLSSRRIKLARQFIINKIHHSNTTIISKILSIHSFWKFRTKMTLFAQHSNDLVSLEKYILTIEGLDGKTALVKN